MTGLKGEARQRVGERKNQGEIGEERKGGGHPLIYSLTFAKVKYTTGSLNQTQIILF